MNSRQLAKLLAPDCSWAASRPRLETQLRTIPTGNLLWVHAAAGMGKTTLVSRFIAHHVQHSIWYRLDESDTDLARFYQTFSLLLEEWMGEKMGTQLGANHSSDPIALSQRFFEHAFAALPPGSWVVLDDAQNFSESPDLEATLEGIARALPSHVTLVCLSRNEPPSWALRRTLERTCNTLGPEQLRCTKEETAALLRSLHGSDSTQSHCKALHEFTQGWAAAVVLLATVPVEHLAASATLESNAPALFDYLQEEFYSRLSNQEKQFLVSTATLPSLTVDTAKLLSGDKKAAALLQRLCRENHLIQRTSETSEFRYHALLRNFLKTRSSGVPAKSRRSRQVACAAHLANAGEIGNAAVLLEQAGDRAKLLKLIRDHAGEMILRGQWRNVRSLLDHYQRVDASNADPWILYWLGACDVNVDTQEARRLFIAAYEKFRSPASKDKNGAYLAWSQIIDSLFFESGDFSTLGEWIDEYGRMRSKLGPSLNKEVHGRVSISLFNALVFLRPTDPRLPKLERRLLLFLRLSPNHDVRIMIASYLLRYYIYRGDLAAASTVVERVEATRTADCLSPLVKSAWLTIRSAFAWYARSPQAGIEAVERSLNEIDASGIRIFKFTALTQGVYSAMALGDVERAKDYLSRIPDSLEPERRMDMGQYLFLVGWLALVEGDTTTALGHMSEALEVAKETNAPYVLGRAHNSLAQVEILRGDFDSARRSLQTATNYISKGGFQSITYRIDLSRAQLAYAQEDWDEGDKVLRQAMALGRREGYVNLPLWVAKDLSTLCSRALEQSIETEYVKTLIARQRLPTPPGAPLNWPWPVRVTTLGGFALYLAGTKFDTTAARVQRPLDLLKCLIALGGYEVSESAVRNALWPDSEGDKAAANLKVNLSRLRKILPQGTITLAKGRLSLNYEQVWLDTHALSMLIHKQDTAVESAIELYDGPFLPELQEHTWTHAKRSALREEFTCYVESQARTLIQNQQYAQATHLLNKAIARTPDSARLTDCRDAVRR